MRAWKEAGKEEGVKGRKGGGEEENSDREKQKREMNIPNQQ